MRVKRMNVTLDAKDLDAESAFWAGLLEGEVETREGWHLIKVDGELRVAIKYVPNFVPPEDPKGDRHRLRLDVWVDDLKEGHDEVKRLGGRLLQSAGDPTARAHFQVYADPAGHPFRLCWAAADIL